jgi:hypothetical protein
MDDNNRKCIGDMYLAAAFLAYDVELVDIDRENPRRQRFIFSGCPASIVTTDGATVSTVVNPTMSDVERGFVSKTLWFPPSYPDCVRRVKAAIHAG